MYLYRVRWYCGAENDWIWSEGIVAGKTMADALARIARYYGEDAIEDVHLAALESGEGILDFEEMKEVVNCHAILPDSFPENFS